MVQRDRTQQRKELPKIGRIYDGRTMKKALLITTVSGFVPQFELHQVYLLQEMGYEVHYASNFHHPHYGADNRRLEGVGMVCHQVDFVRSPFRIRENGRAYRQLKAVLEAYDFALIHCHTPMGGVLGRLAARSCRRKSYVFYTAHGFHFYRGAPWKNWLLYYPIEYWLASYTDVLITLNQEDYWYAKRFRLRKRMGKSGSVERVNGVGMELSRYRMLSKEHELREKKRKELGVSKETCLFLSVGELSKRKNHQVVIRALAAIKEACANGRGKYLICGEGSERKALTKLIARYQLEGIVCLLGYRTDVAECLAAADCFVFPSKQEGLPVALMEAKAVGLPCLCSDIRGNRELAEPEELIRGNRKESYQEKMQQQLEEMGGERRSRTWAEAEKYSKKRVIEQMRRIYAENLEE